MAKTQLPAIEMDQYAKDVIGINILLRNKMLTAFDSGNAKGELYEMIWNSRENLIRPNVRETLKEYWNQNF